MNISIKALLSQKAHEFTPSELKVSETLLRKYPSAALTSISNLAGQAGVSDPTVFRLVVKLGFDGFPSFQKALLNEVDETMNSPLSMLTQSERIGMGSDPQKAMLGKLARTLEATGGQARPEDFEKAVNLIAETTAPQGSVFCAGGRASAFLASRLATHLSYIRPYVFPIQPSLGVANENLMDMGGQDVLIVFDYRRYQKSVVQFAEEAKRRDVRVIVFTDEWRSPIATFADATLCSFVKTASPFDTKVPALAQCEALVAALCERFPEQIQTRLATLERLRSLSSSSSSNDFE